MNTVQFQFLYFDRQYKEYLEHILEYLTSFLYRTEPLQDIEKIFSKASLILPFYYLSSSYTTCPRKNAIPARFLWKILHSKGDIENSINIFGTKYV